MTKKPTYEELEQRVKALENEVADRKQVKEALRKLRYYLDRITSGMYDTLMVIDRNYIIEDVNEGFLKTYGGTREENIGRTCHEVTHGAEKPCLSSEHPCSANEVFRTGKPVQVEHVHGDHGGEDRNIEIYAFPIFAEDGNVLKVAMVSHDVTNRKRAEREQMQREKLQGVVEMAGAVCHELNQPIQAVSARSELMLMDMPEDHPLHASIRAINEQMHKMGSITRKLMEITRYATKEYTEGTKIIDIVKASERIKTVNGKDDAPM